MLERTPSASDIPTGLSVGVLIIGYTHSASDTHMADMYKYVRLCPHSLPLSLSLSLSLYIYIYIYIYISEVGGEEIAPPQPGNRFVSFVRSSGRGEAKLRGRARDDVVCIARPC